MGKSQVSDLFQITNLIIIDKDIHHSYYDLPEDKQNDSASSRTTTPVLALSDDEQRSRRTTPVLPSDQRSEKTTSDQHSGKTTPVLPSYDDDDNERRSRYTPILPSGDNERNILAIEDDNYNATPVEEDNPVSVPVSHRLPPDTSSNKIIKNCEKILIKQGKQIRALYELQKATNEKVSWLQNQIKAKNDKQKNIDLSEKVFGVSITSLYYDIFNMIVIVIHFDIGWI